MSGSDSDREEPTDDRPDATLDRRSRLFPSRRGILKATAAAGAAAGVGVPSVAQETRYELGAEIQGWTGRAPDDIADETNPTLAFEEGTTYVVEWENADGQPHNFVIEDADGNPVVRTDVVSEQGATQTVEFEATRAMSEYYCEVHPQSMRGDVSIEGAPEDDEEEQADGEQFFQRGTEVGVREVAAGMTAPTDFAMESGGDGRMFVTDQTGQLWVVTDDGRREEPFVDVSDRMVTLGEFNGSYADPESEYDERGLLGVELHPDFRENGRFFLHYSAPPNENTPDGWDHVEVVSEFRASDDLNQGDPDSERKLLQIQSPQYNHDAGPMAFGPDGYLYVPMGDGGGANDEMYGHVDDWYGRNAGGNGQNVSANLLGGIHRIDVDAEGEDRPYAIPEDNPLVDQAGRDEYYAWGFRNPFGISFDSEGRLFVADAGQNLFEEANLVERGGNYGWNVKEGTHCFSTDDPGQPPEDCPDSTPEGVRGGEELIDPIVEYPHTYRGNPVGIVITGGHVYEAGDISDLQGKYVFGDWTRDVAREQPQGRILAATEPQDGDGDDGDGDGGDDQVVPRDQLWDMEELVIAGSEDGNLNRFVRQFGQGTDGEVFVLVGERGIPQGDTGAVLELVPPGEGEAIRPPGDGGERRVPQQGEEVPGLLARILAFLRRLLEQFT